MNTYPTPDEARRAVEKYESDLKKLCRETEERIKASEENKRIEKLKKKR